MPGPSGHMRTCCSLRSSNAAISQTPTIDECGRGPACTEHPTSSIAQQVARAMREYPEREQGPVCLRHRPFAHSDATSEQQVRPAGTHQVTRRTCERRPTPAEIKTGTINGDQQTNKNFIVQGLRVRTLGSRMGLASQRMKSGFTRSTDCFPAPQLSYTAARMKTSCWSKSAPQRHIWMFPRQYAWNRCSKIKYTQSKLRLAGRAMKFEQMVQIPWHVHLAHHGPEPPHNTFGPCQTSWR